MSENGIITLRQETIWNHRLLALSAIIDGIPSLLMLDDRFTVNRESNGTLYRIPRKTINYIDIAWGHQIILTTGGAVTAGRLMAPAAGEVLTNGNENECFTTDWDDCVDVAGGYHYSVGLKNDGTIYKSYRPGTLFGSDEEGICGIAAEDFLILLRQDGSVDFDGLPDGDKCGTESWRCCIEVAAGGSLVMGLRSDGRVYHAGRDKEYDFNEIDEWRNIVSIAAGLNHAIGVRDDGSVVAAGSNDEGQCDVGEWKDIVAVAASFNTTLGLRKDGSVIRTYDKKTCSGKSMVNFTRDQVIEILGVPII